MARAARAEGVTLGVLVEVDIGMNRCGVEPGAPALALARQIQSETGLHFVGLQGYDGHLQMLADVTEKRAKCLAALERLVATRDTIEQAGIPVEVVTGAGTGTWEFASSFKGVTEIQPGSFILMDCAYHAVRPEFGCALSILSTVVSRRPGRYVLDAGSKAISKDFGTPIIRDRSDERVIKLAEEHTLVETSGEVPRIGERREVVPAHCLRHHELAPQVRGTSPGQGGGSVADRGERSLRLNWRAGRPANKCDRTRSSSVGRAPDGA